MTTDLFREESRCRFRAEPWQPPLLSKAPSGLMMGMFAVLAASALMAFASTFRFAQKEQVQGYLTPASGWSRVLASEFAIVERRLVSAGDAVQAGDVLLELSSGQGLERAQTVSRKLLQEINERKSYLAAQLELIESQYEIERALHFQEREAHQQELARLERELAFHRSRLDTAKKTAQRQPALSGIRLVFRAGYCGA